MWRIVCSCGMRHSARDKGMAKRIAELHARVAQHWRRCFYWNKAGGAMVPVYRVEEWGTRTLVSRNIA